MSCSVFSMASSTVAMGTAGASERANWWARPSAMAASRARTEASECTVSRAPATPTRGTTSGSARARSTRRSSTSGGWPNRCGARATTRWRREKTLRRARSPSSASTSEMIARASLTLSGAELFPLPAGGVDGGGQALGRPAHRGNFCSPALHERPDRLVAFGLAGGPGGHAPGPVGGLAAPLALGFYLGRPLGVELHNFVGDAGDLPVPEPSRGARVGLDGVAQFDRHPGRGHPAGHGGGVQVLPPQRRVGRLPAALFVLHLHDVGQQDVVVRAGVAGPRSGVAGVGVDEPARGRCFGRLASPPSHLAGHPVQVGEGRIALGVHDPVHVLGPADHPELGHALMGRDHDLHARPASVHQPLARPRVTGATGAEDGLVVSRRDGPLQAQRRPARAAPNQRCLTPGRVVLERHARGSRRLARAPLSGGTRPTRPPSSASSPRPTSTIENATELLQASPGLQPCSALGGVLVARESLVKREFWERAVMVISGDERAGGIVGVISGRA